MVGERCNFGLLGLAMQLVARASARSLPGMETWLGIQMKLVRVPEPRRLVTI